MTRCCIFIYNNKKILKLWINIIIIILFIIMYQFLIIDIFNSLHPIISVLLFLYNFFFILIFFSSFIFLVFLLFLLLDNFISLKHKKKINILLVYTFLKYNYVIFSM